MDGYPIFFKYFSSGIKRLDLLKKAFSSKSVIFCTLQSLKNLDEIQFNYLKNQKVGLLLDETQYFKNIKSKFAAPLITLSSLCQPCNRVFTS